MDSSTPSLPRRLRPRERLTLMILGDVLFAGVALVASLYIWTLGTPDFLFPLPGRVWRSIPLWYYLLPLFWVVLLVDSYDWRTASHWKRTARAVVVAAVGGLVLYLVVYFTSPPRSLPRKGVAGFFLVAALLTLAWRGFFIRVFTAPPLLRRVLVVGAGRAGQTLLKVYRKMQPPPFFLVGFVDDDPQKQDMSLDGFHVLGTGEDLLALIQRYAVTDVVVAITGEIQGRTFQAVLDAYEMGVEVTRMPIMYEELLGRVPIHHLEADWILRSFIDEARVSTFYEIAKRGLDILGGLLGSCITVVLFPFIALAIYLESGGPVLFRQPRVGRGGRTFYILKFRTMRSASPGEEQGKWADDDAHRITKVGAFLRKTHLDEFPQFFNVLRGEMSLVGPRPEQPSLVAELEQRIPFYRARLLVKPGVTGWAQINYGYVATVYETEIKLEYDLYYIKHRGMLFDLAIILRTLGTIVGGKGR